ncbi:MAG: hypothetical protein D3906_08100 [Candidatus Electrothrix sp. AUS1_2]|nr:hypothetical protein [Candidatus Electrothrix sp. AUS1_2]
MMFTQLPVDNQISSLVLCEQGLCLIIKLPEKEMKKVKALWLTIVVGLAVTTVQAEQFKAFEIASADAVSVKVVFSHNFRFCWKLPWGGVRPESWRT